MIEKKTFFILNLTLTVIFYIVAGLLLSQTKESPSEKKVAKTQLLLVDRLHHFLFEAHHTTATLLKDFYSGRLSQQILVENSFLYHIQSIHQITDPTLQSSTNTPDLNKQYKPVIINGDNPLPLLSLSLSHSTLNNLTANARTSRADLYFHAHPENHLQYTVLFSKETTPELPHSLLVTFLLPKEFVHEVLMSYKMDYTVITWDYELKVSTVQSTLSKNQANWLKEEFNKNKVLLPFDRSESSPIYHVSVSPKNEPILLMPVILTSSHSKKVAVVYSTALNTSARYGIKYKMLFLVLFCLLHLSLISALNFWPVKTETGLGKSQKN